MCQPGFLPTRDIGDVAGAADGRDEWRRKDEIDRAQHVSRADEDGRELLATRGGTRKSGCAGPGS